jgi:integrase
MGESNIVQLPLTSAKAQPALAGPVKLTVQRIAALTPESKRYRVYDSMVPGLAVRVEPSGAAAFYAMGRVGKGRAAQKREVRIGSIETVPLDRARLEARALCAQMAQGVDPVAAREQGMSLAELIARFAKRLEARKLVQRRQTLSVLRRGLSHLLPQPARALGRRELVAALNRLDERGLPGAAAGLRKAANAMLNWAANAGHLDANPLAGYRRERSSRAERLARPQVTFTASGELRAFWAAVETAPDPIFRALLRFILRTGARRHVAALATWDQIEGDIWTLPAARTKTGVGRQVFLGSLAQGLLAGLPRLAETQLIFPGQGARPIGGWSQRLRPVKAALGQPHFAAHALRRSYRTGLFEIGVAFDVAELQIGHQRSGLHAHYDKSTMERERRAAQAAWERHLTETVAAC